MPTRSTIRYAAKQAYQLMLMTGKARSHSCGLLCIVHPTLNVVDVLDGETFHIIPIAKSWMNL